MFNMFRKRLNIVIDNKLSLIYLFYFISQLQVELEVERHVLTSTVKLSDGTQEAIFYRKPKRGPQNNIHYTCNLCGVTDLSGERCLYTHIAGRKHQIKLQQGIIDADLFRMHLNGQTNRNAG